MAWIEYHTALRDHWKIQRLAEKLNIPYTQALGAVSCLWLWCAEYSPKGFLGRFSDDEIRFAARISDKKFTFELLLSCELVTEKKFINDWGKHGLKLLESKRKANREYARRKRDSGYPLDTHSVAIPNQPNHTIPNHTSNINSQFETFWKAYPKPVGMSMALLTYKATIKTEKDFQDLMTALKNYMESKEYKEGFIKNGDKWIEDWRGWLNMKPKKEIDKYEVRK